MSDSTKTNHRWPRTCVPETRAASPASLWQTVAPDGASGPSVHLHGESTEASDDSQGQTGRYQLLGEIARGGMGVVLRGRDSELNRDLAVKVLLEQYRENPEVLRRFFEEAQIGGQLQHPGIVPIYDLGLLPDQRPFFAMKLVKGRTFAEMLNERISPTEEWPRFLAIFEQVVQTIAYAHSKRVIHRDLKPLNIMVGAFREVQVMDWGLAKVLGSHAATSQEEESASREAMSLIQTSRSDPELGQTSAGSKMGTPAYMPPEQARGEIDRLDERADVFGLGAILCEILTGRPAYTGRSMVEVMRKAEFADLSDANSRLDHCEADQELITLAKSCLAIEPADRPRDASVVASAISAHLSGVQERLKRAEIAQAEAAARAVAERSKHKMTIAVAASLLLGVGSFLSFQLYRRSQRSEAERHVTDALATAQALKKAAERAGPTALDAWLRALDAAEDARYALKLRPTTPLLAESVARSFDEIAASESSARERVRIIEANRLLSDRLDEARLQGAAVKEGGFDTEAKLRAYARAFREANLVVGERPTAEIVEQLRTAADVTQIAAALDDWADETSIKPLAPQLIEIAERIDPANNPLRRALRSGDRQGILRLTQGDAASRLAPESFCNVAAALKKFGLKDQARQVLQEGRLRHSGDFWLNHDLGMISRELSPPRLEDAIRYLTAAVALKPSSPGALMNLGLVFQDRGDLGEAESCIRQALRLKPDAYAHGNLGVVLFRQGKLVEAEASFRESIRLKPDEAGSHCDLGHCLRRQSRFSEALTEFRIGQDQGSKRRDGRDPAALWILECEGLVKLDGHLASFLRGESKPTDQRERLALARYCEESARFAASSRFWGEAMAHDPSLGPDRQGEVRLDAACSAAAAGCGKSRDEPMPDDSERVRLRHQALDWLREDLSVWESLLSGDSPDNKKLVSKALTHWKAESALSGVREINELAKLPEPERKDWQSFWAEVDSLLIRAEKP